MTITETYAEQVVPAFSLEDRRDTLYARLERGYQTIEQAADKGEEVTHWEQGWLRLLTEYEQICDQIARRTLSGSGVS